MQTMHFPVPGTRVEIDMERHPTWEGREVYEPEVIDVMTRFIKPGQFVIDIGANLGFFTLVLSQLVGELGEVVAFEPDEDAFAILERNVSLAPIQNITALKIALWKEDRHMYFWPMADSGYSSFQRYTSSLKRYKVLARKLDTYLLKPVPSFIKIDAEGADEAILRGAENILSQGVDCVVAEMNLYVMHHLKCSERTMRDYMRDLGYDCFLLEPNFKPLYLPPQYKLQPANGRGAHINVMFAKKARVDELWSET